MVRQGLQRWLLPYADLLTVLFVATLALKVADPPIPESVKHSAMETKAVQMVAKHTVEFKQTTTRTNLSPSVRQLLNRWHARQSAAGEVTLTLPQQVLFASNHYQISPEGLKQLKVLCPVLASLLTKKGGRLRVEGHTDNQQPAPPLTNRQLSALRASGVADVLAAQLHLPQERLIAIGHGAAHPLQPNQTAEGRKANRRVEIILEPNLSTH